ncbi:hypothetical protein QBC34DRAFT_1800 [Podospora aff. communis PSN243]|uniref:Secreted protein n=1 Tax=Podospora aff. communis PSN243 TaxID=3040156 RepID=A0AAV9H9R8_9PEZI|nr:hypothetical protein QBC34DRAFT_1800 [Podospora aff. communis PSN243]
MLSGASLLIIQLMTWFALPLSLYFRFSFRRRLLHCATLAFSPYSHNRPCSACYLSQGHGWRVRTNISWFAIGDLMMGRLSLGSIIPRFDTLSFFHAGFCLRMVAWT